MYLPKFHFLSWLIQPTTESKFKKDKNRDNRQMVTSRASFHFLWGMESGMRLSSWIKARLHLLITQSRFFLVHSFIFFFSSFHVVFFPLPTSLRERRNDHCLIRPAQKSWARLQEFSNFSDVHEFRTNGAGRYRKLNHLLVLRKDSITSEKKKNFISFSRLGKAV